MKGAWQLTRIRGDLWSFRKLPDEHATGGIVAPNVSIISGRTLDQLRDSWKPKGVREEGGGLQSLLLRNISNR